MSPSVRRVLDAADSMAGLDWDAMLEALAEDREWIDDGRALAASDAQALMIRSARSLAAAAQMWRSAAMADHPQTVRHPWCRKCGWTTGGMDSWDGVACKCGTSLPPAGSQA